MLSNLLKAALDRDGHIYNRLTSVNYRDNGSCYLCPSLQDAVFPPVYTYNLDVGMSKMDHDEDIDIAPRTRGINRLP